MRFLLASISGAWAVLAALVAPAFKFADEYRVTRRIVLGIVIWLSVKTSLWAIAFAEAKVGLGGAELGLMIAAVTAPQATLAGFAFKWYMEDSHEGPVEGVVE